MMERIRRSFMWGIMLTKRLYKKWSFVIIMLLIPATVLAYGAAARQDSGVLTVVLAQEDPTDAAAAQTIQELQESSQLVRFLVAESVHTAREQVRMGKADAAWIFPADLQGKIYDFVTAEKTPAAIVQVVVRQKNVALLLANEKLSGTLFKQCARTYYLHYLRQNADVLCGYTDEEILAHYDNALIDDQLFSFSYMDGEKIAREEQAGNYLLSPLRGLLGVIVVICGLATAMYYVRDDEAGTFVLLSVSRKPLLELGYQLISAGNAAIVSLACLVMLGLSVHFGREVVILLLYILCCASFCQLVRALCGSLRPLGAVLPLLVVLMLAVCPIFYDFAALRMFQYLFPPTYYVNAAYNNSFLLYMPIYTVACQLSAALCRLFFNRT